MNCFGFLKIYYKYPAHFVKILKIDECFAVNNLLAISCLLKGVTDVGILWPKAYCFLAFISSMPSSAFFHIYLTEDDTIA